MQDVCDLLNEKYLESPLVDLYLSDNPQKVLPNGVTCTDLNSNQHKNYKLNKCFVYNNKIIGAAHFFIHFEFDENNRMTSLLLDNKQVNFLFNVEDMNGEEFATALTKSYKLIDNLKFFMEDRFHGWKYKSKYGWEIKISNTKEILLIKIPIPTTRSFD